MNHIFLSLGIESWKPLVAGLLMPPLPLLLLVLVGARLMYRHRLAGWLLILVGVLGTYLCTTQALGTGLTQWLLKPPPALSPAQIAELRRAPNTAIVVLGGGRRLRAPEYGVSTLRPRSIERLRYGVWLSRETGLPLVYSGGVGHGARPGPSEADAATRIAEREFGRPLRWAEGESRDTRENGIRTVALLVPQGIEQIVLVTGDYHMRRSLANFERAAAGHKLKIVAAPMAMGPGGRLQAWDWLPSIDGFEDVSLALHEWIGIVAGA